MKELLERAALTTAPDKKTGRGMIQIIDAGWGSSGYYSGEVLEAAVEAKVFKAGTRMYVDHPTASEKFERPERSVHDIAAVLTEDATRGTDGGLVAPIQVVSKYRDSLAELAELGVIGCSIRADGLGESGEAEGRSGLIVTSLEECKSVDFVTTPGRGGKVLMLEADRVVLADDPTPPLMRLSSALTEAGFVATLAADGSFQITEANTAGPGWSFTSTKPLITANSFVPVTIPAGQSESQTPEENPMGQISIEESEHRRLTEAAGRVTTLESERDTAIRERDAEKARADTAETTLAEAKAEKSRTDKARSIIATESTKTGAEFDDLQTRGLLAGLPLTEAGDLDETKFTEAVTTAAAAVLKRQQAAGVHGFGVRDPFQFDESATVTDKDLDALDEAAFGPISQEA